VRNLPGFQRQFPFFHPPPLFLGTISYGEFLKDIDDGNIEEVTVSDSNKIDITFKDGDTEDVIVPDIRSNAIYDKLVEKDVEVNIKEDETRAYLSAIGFILQFALVFIIGSLFFQILSARSSSSSGPFAFAKSKATLHETKDVKIRFSDVAGLDGAKAELQEVVDFLKNPEKYSVVGGKIPKGCLLVGPPGTGKTLLAKAIAGEAGVPFFSCSASEFIELFSGVGAARVRDMFKNAAQKAPCIIFIDEIDAVGKTRGAHSMISGNDEREQTINQLLTEMDGFKDNSGVIVIAATNRVEILDPALLRPGRFDRQIMVELPDFQGRTAILGVHTQNKPLDDTVSLESIAKVTTGYSGADLANLANEAAILAARRNKTKIGSSEFNDALEKIVLGLERKPIASEAKRKLVAYHEAGHTLVALKVGTFDSTLV
jgi:cell division protease FtsH